MKIVVLTKLAWACVRHPELRVSQIIDTAIARYSAMNARNDLYYVGDKMLSECLTKFNKEAI